MIGTYMMQRLKMLGAFLTILFLLPYVVTVFTNGMQEEESGERYVVLSKETEQGGRVECRMEWEECLTAVLAAQITRDMEAEAMKAQAVIVRTNAQRMSAEGGSSEWMYLEEDYLTRKEMEEKWGASDAQRYYEKYRKAVEDTKGITGKYGEDLVWLPFHRSNNGKTRSGTEVFGAEDYPYLKTVECPLDLQAEETLQTYSFSYGDVQVLCREFLVAETTEEQAQVGYCAEDFEILECDQAGYVKKMRIGQTECTGDQFRDALHLASSAFSFSGSGEMLKVTTTGKGHGLGLSQQTANEMAKEGKTYQEILAYFFADVTFS